MGTSFSFTETLKWWKFLTKEFFHKEVERDHAPNYEELANLDQSHVMWLLFLLAGNVS